MTAVLKYDAACRALADARDFDEVRDWADKAAAIKEYARRSHNRSLELDAMEIRERARRRLGELLIEHKDGGSLRHGADSSSADDESRITLDEIGITPNESSRNQKIARLDGDSFERLMARCRAHAEAHPEKHTLDVLKPPHDVTGHRAGMASRLEAIESLDYFPTPPWATRVLMERILPVLGIWPRDIPLVWEPACGEGHMAEVLAEYVPKVIATDVFDYGYGKVADFLTQDDLAEWIVTNPPFGDKATDFMRHAVGHADNVAMFLQLRYLEGLDRYNAIFQNAPPTLCSFFVERVPLHRGRWEPDGDTATAFCWLVWIKGRTPRAPFWIPPGQREALTYSDDRDRFTASPVIKKAHTFAAYPPDAAKRSTEVGHPAVDAARAGIPPDQPPRAGDPLSNGEFLDVPAFLKIGDPACWRNRGGP